ncbi:ribose-phosphate diphosphokinase [Treponema sp. J25]|jgi:ribose-phosphate pyrophosphokinase|uniref:ribose-phosphate diphosphokinase n=1 Tax=Treponema sp. J25 TaxID=2094121 RepID=UPI00104600DD|nr:ribose-phosphate diphosphokinase [Treponema sp. J25]TCW60597.1 phosphoribosylpyrophosphate synthetase [Treponema sp. J25]
MNYTDPTRLGIIACPGGEHFANEVIGHLRRLYRRRFENKTQVLSKRYSLDTEQVIRKINFASDIAVSTTNTPRDVLTYRIPHFKIPARFTYFPNGELKTEILESIRGKDVYVFQDVENHYPLPFNEGKNLKVLSVNDHIMNLFVTVDAVKQAGAERVTLVLPVYPYSRQHKKKGREGLTASRIGKMLEAMGVDRIITLDIHSREIENAFNFLRLENLHASYQIIRKLSQITDIHSENFVVVSPDTGAVDRNKFYATSLKKPLALLYKERDYSRVTQNALDNNIAEIKLLGNVKDKTVFMADDMLGTGGTLLKAMKFLKEQGAREVIAAISLPFFSGDAIQHFDEAYRQGWFYRVIGTNAVYHEELLKHEWYVSVNISSLFAQTISRLHHGRSLSSILDNREIIEKLISQG